MTQKTPVRKAPRIQSLDSDPRDPRVVRVVLAGQTRAVAQLPRESLTELRLAEGLAWTAAVARRVAAFTAHRKTRELSLKCLAQRSHNATTLGAALSRRGVDEGVVARVLAELVKDGWLNDERHAESRALSLGRRHPGISADAAAALLESDGVDAPRAWTHAKRIARDEALCAVALARAVTALRGRGSRHPLAVAASLARRGIDRTIIERALRQEGIDAEE